MIGRFIRFSVKTAVQAVTRVGRVRVCDFHGCHGLGHVPVLQVAPVMRIW